MEITKQTLEIYVKFIRNQTPDGLFIVGGSIPITENPTFYKLIDGDDLVWVADRVNLMAVTSDDVELINYCKRKNIPWVNLTTWGEV